MRGLINALNQSIEEVVQISMAIQIDKKIFERQRILEEEVKEEREKSFQEE